MGLLFMPDIPKRNLDYYHYELDSCKILCYYTKYTKIDT